MQRRPGSAIGNWTTSDRYRNRRSTPLRDSPLSPIRGQHPHEHGRRCHRLFARGTPAPAIWVRAPRALAGVALSTIGGAGTVAQQRPAEVEDLKFLRRGKLLWEITFRSTSPPFGKSLRRSDPLPRLEQSGLRCALHKAPAVPSGPASRPAGWKTVCIGRAPEASISPRSPRFFLACPLVGHFP